nr:mechanosensitive ion channel domain-containing protein [uncultured Massilia sp.]
MHVLCRLFLILALLLSWPGARAQAPTGPTAVNAQAAASAKLKVGVRTVFVFRGTLAGYLPHERAEAARKRIDKVVALGGAQQAGTRAIAEGTQVLLDDRPLFVVTPADINVPGGDTTAETAFDAATQLTAALHERREQESPRRLLHAGALCVAATVGYVLLLRGLAAAQRRMRVATERLISRRLKRIRLRNVALLDGEHVVRFMRQVFGVLLWALRLFATFLWLTFMFGQIPYFRDWGERLRAYLVDTLLDLAAGIATAIPGLLVVVAIAALARMAILTAGSVLKRVETGELQLGWLDRDTAPPTRRLVNVGIVLFALAMAYPYLPGAHTAAFQGVTVLAGLMVSIGGSSIVAQGASGLILMYTRALRKGEQVRIGDAEGTVVELGMFETRLSNGMGAEISLPNALVLSNTTRNFSRTDSGAGCTVEVAVTVGYDTPWRQVHAMLLQAARDTDGIRHEPAPFVAQAALSDFYVAYRLVAQADAATARARVEVRSRLHQQIIDVFNVNGVALTSPHFMQETATPHVIPQQAWSPPLRSDGAGSAG